ncbi:MAG TPA: roadblock/LC7 domain-containing protein [Pseudonocardiaceae bacterium]|jgi:predicted regulator of Ras-like GTPase activity (Roadblock/LC7/MglB family)|nr:roadblock/LC7 domain-containing protein [Pseudonocardiaceae bacterium]
MVKPKTTTDLRWLLDDFVGRVAGADRIVVLSADGLLVSRSSGLSNDDAEHLAAIASAFQGLARGAARHFEGGGVRQTLVEMDNVFLVVTAAGRGACLAVLASDKADLGLIAYEMNILLKRVGTYLSAAPRIPNSGDTYGAHAS